MMAVLQGTTTIITQTLVLLNALMAIMKMEVDFVNLVQEDVQFVMAIH